MSRLLLFFIFFLLPRSSVAQEFKDVRPEYDFQFPRDHGAHHEYPAEWWYFTGHMQSAKSRTYGFELTFFRVGVSRSTRKSAWHVPSLYMAHFAITDDKEKRFYYAKRFVRPSFGRAGASTETMKVWMDTWLAELAEGTIQLQAEQESTEEEISFGFTANLKPAKPLILHGDEGYSRKGPGDGDASYYMSFPRLLGTGMLELGGVRTPVEISAWMDHEVLSFDAGSGEVGWDWFAIQFDNGEELVLYTIRREGKIAEGFSYAAFVSADGALRKFKGSEFEVKTLSHWTSSKSKKRYPSLWEVSIPSLNLQVKVTPTVEDQELVDNNSLSRTYWEGRSKVQGTGPRGSLTGNAYVELVGY